MILDLDFEIEVPCELDAAFDWHERQRPGLGVEFPTAVEAAIGRLRLHPEITPVLYWGSRRGSTDRFHYEIYKFTTESSQGC